MNAKADCSQERLAVSQWLRKKPQDHVARRIPTLEALPEPVRALLLQALLPEEHLQWMVDFPSQGILRQKSRVAGPGKFWPMWELTPGWLVALTDQRLLLVPTTNLNGNTRMIAIPVEDILYLEQGMILLSSWIDVHWIADGASREETLYYNAVSEDIVLPFIQMLRCLIARSPPTSSGWVNEQRLDDPRDRENLQRELPLKFLNMIPRYGLLDGEHIRQAVYRPAQWRSLLGLVRVMTTPRLVALRTNAYLLLAAEDRSTTETGYGLILTFLPIQFVQSMQAGRNGKRCSLNIHLQTGQAARDWSIPFPLEMEEAVRAFART